MQSLRDGVGAGARPARLGPEEGREVEARALAARAVRGRLGVGGRRVVAPRRSECRTRKS